LALTQPLFFTERLDSISHLFTSSLKFSLFSGMNTLYSTLNSVSSRLNSKSV
jgi:hypothetical protein